MALEGLKRSVARYAPLTRWLFGITVPSGNAQGHWDYSTLVLFAELKERVRPGQNILELGTGETGTLSNAMAKRVKAHYLALDIDAGALASATKVAAANGVEVEFLQSDLLSAVSPDRSFDLTFFNPPYVPRSLSAHWKTLGEPSRVWDGGEDGLDVIRKFWVAAGERGATLGTVLMGFNRKSVSEKEIEALAKAQGFSLVGLLRAPHPGTVYIFEVPEHSGSRKRAD
ncbi:MAG: methyltransferase [Vicinamibacteria bacterium]